MHARWGARQRAEELCRARQRSRAARGCGGARTSQSLKLEMARCSMAPPSSVARRRSSGARLPSAPACPPASGPRLGAPRPERAPPPLRLAALTDADALEMGAASAEPGFGLRAARPRHCRDRLAPSRGNLTRARWAAWRMSAAALAAPHTWPMPRPALSGALHRHGTPRE